MILAHHERVSGRFSKNAVCEFEGMIMRGEHSRMAAQQIRREMRLEELVYIAHDRLDVLLRQHENGGVAVDKEPTRRTQRARCGAGGRLCRGSCRRLRALDRRRSMPRAHLLGRHRLLLV